MTPLQLILISMILYPLTGVYLFEIDKNGYKPKWVYRLNLGSLITFFGSLIWSIFYYINI